MLYNPNIACKLRNGSPHKYGPNPLYWHVVCDCKCYECSRGRAVVWTVLSALFETM